MISSTLLLALWSDGTSHGRLRMEGAYQNERYHCNNNLLVHLREMN
jgi:hypothetical protein